MNSSEKKVPPITAEEYYRITEQYEERTELLNGEMIAMASPSIRHQRISGRLFSLVDSFITGNGGSCTPLQAVDVELNNENVVVPDFLVLCDPDKMDELRCYGAPDWIVEIMSTNRNNDLITKLWLYRNAGVREYWIVDPKNEKTLVYFFDKSEFPNIYTFDTPIPVGIFAERLAVRIADLL